MERSNIGSHLRRVLTGLALASAMALATAVEAKLHSITIGQNGQLNWRGEGTAPVDVLPARHRLPLDPNKFAEGNDPGKRVELDSGQFPGSLHALEITETDIADGTLERGGAIAATGIGSKCETCFAFVVIKSLPEILKRDAGGQTKAMEIRDGLYGVRILLDLGGRFGVSRIRFYPRNTVQPSPTTPFQDSFLRAFDLFSNDGVLLTKHGAPKYQVLTSQLTNKNGDVDIELSPPRILRHIRLVALTDIHWEIDEIEILGEGFVPDGRYVSNIFDAGEPVAWTSLRWTEEIVNLPELSSMEIRTRTGTDDSPFVFTRRLHGKRDAEEIPFVIGSDTEVMTQKDYGNLSTFDDQGRQWDKGNVLDDLVDWSPFSAPYPAAAGAGVPILSPSPRQYFQFQVSFESSDLAATRILNSLSFSYASPPLADSLRGEIFPREADVSGTSEFTYSVLALIRSPGLSGFDTIEIGTPSRVESIDSVELLNADGERLAFRAFTGLNDTTLVDGFRVVSVEDDRFALQFPHVREARTRVDARFRARVFTYSTDFAARVRLQSEAAAFQAVDSGDAGLTTVLSPQLLGGGRLLDAVDVQPNPFTPNGDGINDELSVRYGLLSVTALTPVSIRVYDLAGRLVTVISDVVEGSGHYDDKSWDGRDAQGKLLAPGLYLVRVEVDGDAENAEQAKVVSLVY